jgi:hypothetical protein
MDDAHSHTILFLAASPSETPRRELDREAHDIADELARSRHRERFVFETRWDTTPLDLLRALRKVKPTVVHIAAHVSAPQATNPGLIVQDGNGGQRFVATAALTQLFAAIGAQVRLVVLDGCYRAEIADALLAHVDCVVGVEDTTDGTASRAFSVGFYGSLGDGESVPTSFACGAAAIALVAGDALSFPEPVLRVARAFDVARLFLADLAPPARRGLIGDTIYLQLGAHLIGAPGFVLAGATLLVAALGLRTWFALGESDFALRVQHLAVQAADPPQPVQDTAAVREMTALATIMEGAPPGLSTDEHRIALRGAFAEIDLAGRSAADPDCRLHLAAERGRVAIDRATQAGAPCDHRVVVAADAAGLVLTVDEGRPVAIAPGSPLVLRLAKGTAVRLGANEERLSLFRPANNVVWPATAVEARAAAGERVRLPGGLRSSDSVELTGTIELRELALDGDRLVVAGALRGWRGSVGRNHDWDAAAPWPPAKAFWWLLAALAVLALYVVVQVRGRWRALRGEAV